MNSPYGTDKYYCGAVAVCRTRPVYVQSTWLKSRAVMDKFPMRYGFVTDLLEEISL
jgi:hypothetical protein